VSRLDSFIRRLEAQRACLDRAASLIAGMPGPVLELGLGNGRTFDHLRHILPDRDIFVFERHVAAHPDCTPAPDRLILGDLRETLPQARQRFAGRAALAHLDIATGEVEASRRLAAALAPLLAPLLRPGAVVVSEPPLAISGWNALPLPEKVDEGRYHLYGVAGAS
jgi:S-adenosyl-L-methionine methyltransferase